MLAILRLWNGVSSMCSAASVCRGAATVVDCLRVGRALDGHPRSCRAPEPIVSTEETGVRFGNGYGQP
ncbi:MAG: hypothetical protein AAGL17_16220 [Cyanobacteria bacterium J06576_12]